MNQYTSADFQRVKCIAESHHAKEFSEPILNLVVNLIAVFAILYFIARRPKKWQFGWIVLLALFLLRLFMLFHDMCHKSYFPSDERKTNRIGINTIVANCIDFLCSYSAGAWAKLHSDHHEAHGNLNLLDETRTVITRKTYDELPTYQKMLYNLFRHPLIFFLLVPLYAFWIARVMYFDIVYLVKYSIFLFVLYKIGKWRLLLSFVLAQYIAGVIGLMLFHLQHQINVGYWAKFDPSDKLSKENADFIGSSVLTIPPLLDFFTNGIEYHNVHHVDPGVPSYNTRKCYEELRDEGLLKTEKSNYLDMWKGLNHTLYNEKTGRYE